MQFMLKSSTLGERHNSNGTLFHHIPVWVGS